MVIAELRHEVKQNEARPGILRLMSARRTGVGAKWILALLATALTVGKAPAQRPSKAKNDAKSAHRFLTFLELPARRTQAVRGLLMLGSASVPALLRGANHPNPAVVTMSMHMLGELGPLAAPATSELQAIADNRRSPNRHAASWALSRIQGDGRILIADYTVGQILAVPPGPDGAGGLESEVLLKNMGNAWDVEPLGNGNYLVTHYTDNKVVEYSPAGKEVWSYSDLGSPLDADRLPNGNTLISDTYKNRVIEVDPAGKIVWEHKDCKMPYDADRLPDGNTLISEYRTRVVEIDPKGKVVWEHKRSDVFGADRLRNGHTLLTAYTGEVIELDHQCNVMFRLKDLKSPNEARRLSNGNTIVAEKQRIREFDRTGKVVRTIPLATRPGTLHVR